MNREDFVPLACFWPCALACVGPSTPGTVQLYLPMTCAFCAQNASSLRQECIRFDFTLILVCWHHSQYRFWLCYWASIVYVMHCLDGFIRAVLGVSCCLTHTGGKGSSAFATSSVFKLTNNPLSQCFMMCCRCVASILASVCTMTNCSSAMWPCMRCSVLVSYHKILCVCVCCNLASVPL